MVCSRCFMRAYFPMIKDAAAMLRSLNTFAHRQLVSAYYADIAYRIFGGAADIFSADAD